MQVAEFPLYVGRIADALAAKAAAAAANAMATEFHAELTDVTLRKSSHAPGTPTPSAPGSPPALVSGTLRRSAQVVPALATGTRAVSACRVAAVYARIQERGGVIRAKRAPYLRWHDIWGWHQAKSVTLPARPYMEPTLALLVSTGRLRARASQAAAAVAREAAAGG